MPYEGSTLAELAVRRDSERPLPPHSYDESVPETLSAVVLRALANDPEFRYPSARALAGALRLGLAGEDAGDADEFDEGPTEAIISGPQTERTRRLAMDDPEPTPRALRSSAPAYRAPPAAGVPTAAGRAPKRRSFFGMLARVVGALLLIGAIAAIVVIAVLLVTDVGQDTDVGQIIKENLDEQVDALRDFIERNTGG